jgi:hypothetical protein
LPVSAVAPARFALDFDKKQPSALYCIDFNAIK